jgi:1,2-diacylglycerol 3-alpha-glucosyltransferase
LASSGHQITIFAPKPKRGGKISFNPRGISLELLPSMPSFLYPDFRAAMPISPKLLLKVKELNPDIIHFQTTFLVGGGGVILGKLLKKPVIGSFHGYFMEPEYLKVLNISRGAEILSRILWKYVALFFSQCDVALTYSEGAKRDLKQHGVKKPIFAIPNSIDEGKIKKAGREQILELRQRHNLSKTVALYVGRLSAEKSLDILVKSFSFVLKKVPDATLLLIGDGPIRKDIIRLCSSLKIGKRVVFTGQIPQEKLLQEGYYQLADVFVTASTSELQPVSIIEAMYFGLPLVGVAKRGALEMIQGVGLVSQPNEIGSLEQNIIKVISDKNVHDELSKNSLLEYERKYKLKKVVKAYDSFYKQVVKRYNKSD